MLSAFLPSTTMLPLEILLQLILKNSMASSYCVTFVVDDRLNFQTSISFIDIVTNGTDTDGLMYQILEVSEKGCSDFVVKIKKPTIFMKAFDRANILQNIRRSDKKIVILPYEDSQESVEDLFDILPMKEITYLANLLLIIPVIRASTNCMTYDLVTHKFVGPEKTVGEPKYMDRWNSCTSEFEKEANLFPHNVANLEGKTLKLACFTYTPYTILDLDPSVKLNGRDGIEIRIIEEFCRWVNCTIELVRNDEEQWGEIYDNKTGTGVLGAVVEDRADLAISALYSWYEEFIWLDFSAATIRSLITCIAPAPRLLVSWEMPLLPFSWNMWVGMVMTFFFSAFALTYVRLSSDKAFLIAFGILTAQSYDESHSTWRIRSVTGWVIVTALVLSSAYGAGLATTFTVPKYEKPIDTIKDLIHRKMEWGATHDAWTFSLALSQEPLVKQLISQFRVYSFEELKRKSFTRSMAFSIEQLPSGCFAIGGYITREAVLGLRLMKESFYYEQNVVMMRKSSPYTQKIDELIGRLHQTGLLLAWEEEVALKYLDTKIQLGVKRSRSKQDVEIQSLSFHHIVGIFYFYVIGIGFSLILFIIEIISVREKKSYAPTW